MCSEEKLCFFCNEPSIKISLRRKALVFDRQTFRYGRCNGCSGYSLYPLLTNRTLEKLYSTEYLEVDSACSDFEGIDGKGYRISLENLSQLPIARKTVVDFGSGAESKVRELIANLDGVYLGVEFSPTLVEYLKSHYPEAKYIDVNEFYKLNRKFDYIFLGDVLEHLSPPLPTLVSLVSKLNHDGKLLIQGPLENSSSLSHFLIEIKSILSKGRAAPFPPYHVSLASRRAILRLMDVAGLKVETIVTYEVSWPVKPISKFFNNSLMEQLKMLAKQIDFLMSLLLKKKGNRFFLVASRK